MEVADAVQEGVLLNQATIAAFGAVLTPLLSAITFLFFIVKGRLDRAEHQVDSVLALTPEMLNLLKSQNEAFKSLQSDMKSNAENIRDMKQILSRDYERRN